MSLAAPFPYFGGKRRVAATVWEALGDPSGYVEPMPGPKCTCPDPWCPTHAICGVCGDPVIILPDDPAFCPSCNQDVMPARACNRSGVRDA